jgi:transmembrane sensor
MASMTAGSSGRDREAAIQAADWFVRLNGEGATGDDWLAFEAWLQASPVHAEAYGRVERLWVELEAEAPRLAEALDARARRARPARSFAWAWPAAGAALAAGLALAVTVGVRERAPAPLLYETRPGEIREITLADGSHVRLNAASRLSVTLTPRGREVAMQDGEAAFDVAHDAVRPFRIHVGESEVRVVGTEFDVRHRDGLLRVAVRRGVVEVRPQATAEAAPVRLTVAEQLVHRDGAAGAEVSPVEPDEAFGWIDGQLVYHDQPLAEVAADLSRRFGASIRPADAETARLRFTGVLTADSEPAVLRRLEAFSGVTAERTADGVLLRRQSGRR